MSYCFILSSCKSFSDKYCKIIDDETLYQSIPINTLNGHDSDSPTYWQPVELFKYVEQKLTSVPASTLCRSAIVIDDNILPHFLDPLSTKSVSNQLYSMLILAFPELQFVFKSLTGLPCKYMHFIDWLSNVRCKKPNEYYREEQLFDPHGIRETIKLNIRDTHRVVTPEFPLRNNLSLSVEDEPSYALFHAYTCYKSFYKCKVINSFHHLECLQNEVDYNNEWRTSTVKWLLDNKFETDILFDDHFLNFYDRTAGESLSNIQERYDKYEVLGLARKKILVTVGQVYSNYHESVPEGIIIIEKPGKGLYSLQDQANLLEDYKESRDKIFEKNLPVNNKSSASLSLGNNHSTPGRLLIIAESLLARAEKLLDHIRRVPVAIHAATLALDAKELLGNLTPTASFRALAIQHQAEVAAECLFYGVEYEKDLNQRFEDLRAETRAISKRFKKENQNRQYLNAYLNILEHLAKEFNGWNQFDEELACLNEARKIRHELKVAQSNYFIKPFKKILYWYFDNSIFSFKFHAFLIGGWILGFALLFWLISLPCLGEQYPELEFLCIEIGQPLDCYDALLVSAASFFTVDTSPDWVPNRLNGHSLYVLLFVIQSLIAFVHLSLLVAYMFMKFSRR